MSTDIFSINLGIDSCYLIRGKTVVMIDGGVPNKLRAFKNKLSKLHIHPEEIKLIVLTHSHIDHAGSARSIRDLTGAKIAIHEKERMFLEEGGMVIPKGVNLWGKITQPVISTFFKRMSFPKVEADIVITGNEFLLSEYGIDGKIIHTPGHTPGSISLLLNTGEAFVGCMAHNGFPFRRKPGLPIYAENISDLKESWKRLIDMGAKTVFPGHGKPFPVEIIKNIPEIC